MKKTSRALACVLVILMVLPARIALSQASSANNWEVLRGVPVGQKVLAKLKNGKTVDGEFTSISDTMLTLSKKNKATSINRDDIAKLYRIGRKSVGKTTLTGTAIGAGAGAALGAAVGEDCNRGSRSGIICLERSLTIPVGAAVGAIPGAVTGLIIGIARRKRDLIYESK